MLGLIVLGAVLAVTAVFALAAYLIDKGEERLEEQEGLKDAPDSAKGKDDPAAKFARP